MGHLVEAIGGFQIEVFTGAGGVVSVGSGVVCWGGAVVNPPINSVYRTVGSIGQTSSQRTDCAGAVGGGRTIGESVKILLAVS